MESKINKVRNKKSVLAKALIFTTLSSFLLTEQQVVPHDRRETKVFKTKLVSNIVISGDQMVNGKQKIVREIEEEAKSDLDGLFKTPPNEQPTYFYEKIFPKFKKNNYFVEFVKQFNKHDKKDLFIKNLEKTTDVKWERDSYTSLKLLNEIIGYLKKQTNSLDKNVQKELNSYLKNLENLELQIEEYSKKMLEMGVPEYIANMKRDGSITPLREATMFLLISYLNADNEMKDKLKKAIDEKGIIDIGYFMGGYGKGEVHYINLNPEDSQIAILYRTLDKLSKNYDISKIDWVGVSFAASGGNPFQLLDFPYRNKGKYPDDYETKMYDLLKSYIVTNEDLFKITSLFNINKYLRNIDMDPETSYTAIPHENIREEYKNTKKEINKRILKLIESNPMAIYFLIDIRADLKTYLLTEGFNVYIRDPNGKNPASKKTNKEIFEDSMKKAKNYLTALELCFKSINQNVPLILEKIQKAKNIADLYPTDVAEILISHQQKGDITITSQNEKELSRLSKALTLAFLSNILPNYVGSKEFFITNPWFRSIAFEKDNKISATLTDQDIKDAEKIIKDKWNSLILVPKDIISTEETTYPEFNPQTGIVSNVFRLKILSFNIDSKKYEAVPGDEFTLQPMYTTALKRVGKRILELLKTDGVSGPKGDRFEADLRWFSPTFLTQTGWKLKKQGQVPNTLEISMIFEKENAEAIILYFTNEVPPRPTRLEYYPVPISLLNLIEFTRAKALEIKRNEDNSYFVKWEIYPPHGRYVGAGIIVPEDNRTTFNRDKKEVKMSFVEREPSPPSIIIHPSNSNHSSSNVGLDQMLFESVSRDLGINSSYLYNLYNASQKLNEAYLNGDDPNSAYKNLVSAARNFTSAIWSKLNSDPTLSTKQKQFLNDFRNGKTDDMTTWTDIMKDRNYGGAADLSRVFQEVDQLTMNIKRSMKINTWMLAFETPITIVPYNKDTSLLSFSGIIYGRAYQELKGEVKRTSLPINSDGTYGNPVTEVQKIKKEEENNIVGGRFVFGLKKTGKKYGTFDLIFGGGLRNVSFTGAGDNLVDSILTSKDFFSAIAGLPRGIKVSYTDYSIFGERHFTTRLEANYISLAFLSDLFYWTFGKKVYSPIDLNFGDVFSWDRRQGFEVKKDRISFIESSYNLSNAKIGVKKELGGDRATEAFASWNNPFGLKDTSLGIYGRFSGYGLQYGVAISHRR